jgi:ubiquinone/menaquinone biosynthesis C-methylase UbiE/esterase/lipase
MLTGQILLRLSSSSKNRRTLLTSTTFYERRKRDHSIEFGERRVFKRRYQRQNYISERRRLASQVRLYERESLPITVRLQGKGEKVSANAHDISPLGVRILGDVILSPGTSVALKFYFGDNVSYLCFPGQVIYCRSVINDEISDKCSIGIRFALSRPGEEEILISIIQDIRQRALKKQKAFVSVIISEDSFAREGVEINQDILSLSDGKSRMTLLSCDTSERMETAQSKETLFDRRFSSRIAINLSGHMEIKDPSSGDKITLQVDMMNLSDGGVTITSDKFIYASVNMKLELNFNPYSEAVSASGRIVWNHSKFLDPLTSKYRYMYGIQFARVGDTARHQIGRFLSQQTLTREQLSERRVRTTIVSELIHFKNRDGENIVGFYDHLRNSDVSSKPFVLIPPAYGETKKEALSFSWYLVKNGFNVIRYDNTHHVGESDGEIYDTTFKRMKSDLLSALDYISALGCENVGVVAASLSSRSAIKAASEDRRINLLICITPIIDLQNTLKMIYNYDIIAACVKDRSWISTNVLGFEVNRNFVDTAIHDKFHDLQSTMNDLREVHIPVIFLAAQNDPWININDIKKAYDEISSRQKEIYMIPDAMHRLEENPKSVKSVKKQITRICLKYLCKQETVSITEPDIREMVAQNRIERQRTKYFRNQQREDEKNFWKNYLNKFKYIVNIHHYWNLLQLIFDSLGKINKGEVILDAGCGNGSFGAFLLVNVMYKNQNILLRESLPLFSYVGIDFVDGALKEATSVQQNLHLELIEKIGTRRLVSYSHVLSDLNDSLNFKNDSFDKICCNLVISYLQNPLFTLRELARVLKPKGRLVVTSLKPHADLTEIYRNFIKVAETDEEIEEAWKLLNNAGAIKCKEAEGYYHFFSESELTVLLNMAGFKRMQSSKVLANQASLIVCEKD